MATAFKEGDRVQIVDREATADDVKSGMFYNHYRNLTGSILKVYATDEASVEIEIDSLAEPVAQRHIEVQAQMKEKWLDGLSEEAKGRLSDKERDFKLRYTILVSTKDIAAPTKKAAVHTPPVPDAVASAPAPKAVAAVVSTTEPAPRRRTSSEIEADEEEYLKSRQRDGK